MGALDGIFNKNSIMSMVANFSTAYNLKVIAQMLAIQAYVYPEENPKTGHNVHSDSSTAVKTAALVGAIVGQLTMGYVGDAIGRSKAMNLTMALTLAGCILSSVNPPYGYSAPGPNVTAAQVASDPVFGASSIHGEFVWLTFCRFLLGVGVGGVYPLAATVAAESSEDNTNRGIRVSVVFSTQGLGFLATSLLGMLVMAINPSSDVIPPDHPNTCAMYYKYSGVKYYTHEEFHMSNFTCPSGDVCHEWTCPTGANDVNWRVLAALGALPGILMLPFSVTETAAIKDDTMKTSTFWADISDRQHWTKLIGTAGGWFLFDIVFYGNTLFASAVTKAIYKDSTNLMTEFAHNTVLFAIALPGYYVATALMEKLGRKNIQMLGFFMMFVLYITLSQLLTGGSNGAIGAKAGLSPGTLLFLYGLTFFFANFGPNSTTFILPSETFPAEVRTSLNGFSAAMGKAGAAIGSAMFLPLADAIGAPQVIMVCGFISLAGFLVTYFFVEDRRGKAMASSGNSAYGSVAGSINTEKTSLLHPVS